MSAIQNQNSNKYDDESWGNGKSFLLITMSSALCPLNHIHIIMPSNLIPIIAFAPPLSNPILVRILLCHFSHFAEEELGVPNARGVGREQRGNVRGGCMSKLCVE